MKSAVTEMVYENMRRAILKIFPSLEFNLVVTTSKFGDYQCNSAMSLYSKYKDQHQYENPFELAESIASELKSNESLFERVEVSQQGFITVKVQDRVIIDELKKIWYQPQRLIGIPSEKLTIAMDFSHPNIAKEMHVGHLRSTIIGNCLANILESLGHKVLRMNHLGDWGTQFGMLIEYLKRNYPDFKSNIPEIKDLQSFYKQSKELFDSDQDFKKNSQLNVVKLQRGDKEEIYMWEVICEISRREFQKVYDRLKISLEEKPESFYNYMLKSVEEELVQSKLAVESDGAICIFVPGYKVPLMVVKSDGGYGYDSTDLATIKYRLHDQDSDWILYVVDMGQQEHFEKVFYAARASGWVKRDHKKSEARLEFIGFGVVQGGDNKKFKTRSGDVVKMTDLLDEAVERQFQELKRRDSKNINDNSGLIENNFDVTDNSEENLRKIASHIGYSAVKYFELHQNRFTSYKFNYDKILSPKGNTAVYMLYTYARICSIFRNCGVDNLESLEIDSLKIENNDQREILLNILRLPDTINSILEDFFVNRLADHMYTLAELFTQFYHKFRIIDDENMNNRLVISALVKLSLKTCFDLMGIEPLEKI